MLSEGDWEQILPDALFIIRSVKSESTGKTPHESFFNFKRKVFAEVVGLDNCVTEETFSWPKGLEREAPVFIRNFVRNKKKRPACKGTSCY
jgi:hypothetical protein